MVPQSRYTKKSRWPEQKWYKVEATRSRLIERNKGSGVYQASPNETLVLRCYKCQVSFEVDSKLKVNPALEEFSATHQPHGQLFIGTNDENGKFQGVFGPGEFHLGGAKDQIRAGSNR